MLDYEAVHARMRTSIHRHMYIACPLQQWFLERASLLRSTYFACFVCFFNDWLLSLSCCIASKGSLLFALSNFAAQEYVNPLHTWKRLSWQDLCGILCRCVWAGHVAHMVERRCACWVLVGKPERRSPLGRRRHRWEDNIKVNLRGLGWRSMDWFDLTQVRDKWRALVNAVMIFWEFADYLRTC